MNDLINFIYVEGDVLQTVCRIFVLGIGTELVYMAAALISHARGAAES